VQDFPRDSDGDVLRGLAAAGNDMSAPMQIEFYVWARDVTLAQRVAGLVEALGYATEVFIDDTSSRISVYCTREMIPQYDLIIQAQKDIDELLRPFDMICDGWGTLGNA
jgi:regulator of RNase E activity RraB